MSYTEVEAKVREATNDDAWGPTGAIMQEISQYTFTYEHFPEVMGMLWKRMLLEDRKNWRRVYKVNFLSELVDCATVESVIVMHASVMNYDQKYKRVKLSRIQLMSIGLVLIPGS